MNRVLPFILFIFFVISISFVKSQEKNNKKIELLDAKGNKVVIDSFSYNQPLVIIFFHNYNCIGCFNSLKEFIKNFKKSNQNFESIVVCRTRKSGNVIESFELKKGVNKIFGNVSVYFDIHQNVDSWPPSKLQDGLFGKYKLTRFPAVLVIKGYKEVLLTYDELFFENYNSSTINELLQNAIKEVSK